VAALQKNRALRAALASALTGLSQVEDTVKGQERCLSGNSKGKSKRLNFASAFSSPQERKLAPPKNADAIRRGLFAEKYLGSLKEYTWTKQEDVALARTLKTRLKEEVFQTLLGERLQSHQACGGLKEQRHDVYNESLEEVHSLSLPVLWERRGGQVDWKCVSERLRDQGIKRCPKSCFTRFTQKVDPSLTHKKFEKDEDKALLQLATENEGFDWEAIAARMPKSTRTAFQCFERYQRALNPKLLKSSWTKSESDRLDGLLQRAATAGPNHVALASQLGSARIVHQVAVKARRKRTANATRTKWTNRELRKLELLGRAYGTKSVAEIVQHLPGRSEEQCHLMLAKLHRGGLQTEPWTEEEDRILDEVIERHGVGRWTLASRFLPGRLPHQTMLRFYKRNPKHLADMYAILLATREKMIPKARSALAKDATLVASDFSLHLYHVAGKDGLEITTGDPYLDQYLSRLNQRRKQQLANPDEGSIEAARKRKGKTSGAGDQHSDRVRECKKDAKSLASAPLQGVKRRTGRAAGSAKQLASAPSQALKTPAGAASGGASSSSCPSRSDAVDAVSCITASAADRLQQQVSTPEGKGEAHGGSDQCEGEQAFQPEGEGNVNEGLCTEIPVSPRRKPSKPDAEIDDGNTAGPLLSPASTCCDDPMSDIENGADDLWTSATEPFTLDSMDVNASPRSQELECPLAQLWT